MIILDKSERLLYIKGKEKGLSNILKHIAKIKQDEMLKLNLDIFQFDLAALKQQLETLNHIPDSDWNDAVKNLDNQEANLKQLINTQVLLAEQLKTK